MISKCCMSLKFILLFLYVQGAACFFVKHVKRGMCLNVTGIYETQEHWGSLSFVGLSNKCLDPTVQNRFLHNSALFSLKTKTCFEGTKRSGYPSVLYLLDATNPKEDCRDNNHAVTQSSWGGLSINYLGGGGGTQCAVPKTNSKIKNAGVDPYIGLEICNNKEDQRFNFGSVTCSGNMTKDVNCPKDQYMVVKTASYRRLSPTEKCASSNNSDCEIDVTCRLKKQCDGQRQCNNITVNDNLFPSHQCPGGTKSLYFEYQCSDTVTSFGDICVDSVSLSHSSLPNEGFLNITTDKKIKNVCWQHIENAENVVCRELGYKRADSLVEKEAPPDLEDANVSRNIVCNDHATKLSQCSVGTSSQSCSNLSYLKCHICDRPLLEDKQRFPDASFTASAPSGSPSDARISSGSSWCAPVADGKHYLQVNFERLYVIYNFVTFGDATIPKWVTTYNLNYTDDGKNWKSVQTRISGNKYAYNDAAIQTFSEGITTRALRFIPLSFEGQPCMRIEICGATQFPDKPTNLAVTNIKSRRAEISWKDPDNSGDGNLTKVWIKLKKKNSLIPQNITKNKINAYKLDPLTPVTTYEISVAAGNKHGFGEEIMTSFTTSEDAPEGPPLNVTVTAEISSSLSVTWEPPEKDRRNGMIVSYTVCVSHEENKPCFWEYTTKEKMTIVDKLTDSTKYYIRVLASTKVGRGPYSESRGKFTNGKQLKMSTNGTASTLTFFLQIPQRNFTHFYVVVLKLKDGKQAQSPGSYENNELVTYSEAEQSTNPKPYIAATLTSNNGNMFILGDGRNISNPTSRRRRSTTSVYYNGPLKPDTSYSIFQRIFINNKGDYYSTDWSPPSKTSKYSGGPRVLTDISSDVITAKEGDFVNLLCSAQGEPPITFSWVKDKKPLEIFMEKEKPHRSSLLVVTVKDQTSFGNYICHIRDRFQSISTHTISVQKYTEDCEECGKDDEKYLVGIIVVIVLLVVSFAVIAYLTYQNRQLKSSRAHTESKNKDRNNSKDIYEIPDKIKDDANYEQVETEQSTYTALKKTGKDKDDDHLYAHLNDVHNNYENQKETGM